MRPSFSFPSLERSGSVHSRALLDLRTDCGLEQDRELLDEYQDRFSRYQLEEWLGMEINKSLQSGRLNVQSIAARKPK